jgi:hypothetical protein
MTADLTAFLEQFRPGGYTTYVAILPNGDTIAETFNGTDPHHAERWIRKQNRDHRGIYYTVNATPAGLRRKPAKADITSIDGVWSDVDPLDGNGRSWSEERERLEALADELHALPWPPTFIVDSGNGIQPNWLLADPIEANDEYRQAAESLCSQIEAVLGAKGTHNVDRLLRCPGTRNYPNEKKRKLGRGETESRIMRWTWRRYSWTELEQLAEHLRCNPLRHAVPCEPPRPRVSLGDVALPGGAPEPLEAERVEELRARYPDVFDLARYDGDQSRQDLALASLARRLAWSQQDTWRLIIALRGDRKALRRDYVDRTLARAYAEQPAEDGSDHTAVATSDDWEAPLLEAIDELNAEHFVVKIGGQTVVATIAQDEALKRELLVFSQERDIRLYYKHRHYLTGHTAKGTPIWKGLGEAWLEHRNRRTFKRIALVPKGQVPAGTFNLWRGFGVEPQPGKWPLIRRHLLEVICAGNESDCRWLCGCPPKTDGSDEPRPS